MSVVDYDNEDVARRYAGGRVLRDDVLDAWGAAVRKFVPERGRPVRVLDVGAGTGIFARAWPSWADCRVVALEPSPAMRAEMVAAGLGTHTHVVAGRGEHLPLPGRRVDVAWLSAVVHHFVDLAACARELRRVVVDDGVVLIRGLVADGQVLPSLRSFPGWERVVGAFPAQEQLEAVLAAAGFRPLGRVEVRDQGPSNVGEALARVRRLRHADSLLGRFTDDEIAAGLRALEARDPTEPLEPATLTLLAFGAPPSHPPQPQVGRGPS